MRSSVLKLLCGVVFVYIFVLQSSCGRNTRQASTPRQVIQNEGFEDDDSLNGVYRHYMGTIAGVAVVLHYVQYGDKINCQYYYEKTGKPINLYYNADTTGKGALLFSEYPDVVVQDTPNTWEVYVKGDSLTGTWRSKDGSKVYPILLMENYGNGIQHFGVVSVHDTESCNIGSAFADARLQVLLPVGEDSATEFIRSAIVHSIGCDGTDGNSVHTCMDGIMAKYFEEYKAAMKEVTDTEHNFFNNWSTETGFGVVYNKDGIVVLSCSNYEYTGGAHGNYGTRYLCIDSKNRKQYALADIVSADTAMLVPMLEAEVRSIYSIAEADALNGYLLVEQLHLPEQFYITNKGITFVYSTYEIAAYAMGEINIFIPYSRIGHLLTPAFRQRMGLGAVAANR